MDFNYKRIADSVHKTIGLSRLEVQLIETEAFQRLRHVKHLGLADYVFPGADFSRLSHCIGACHVIGLLLEGLQLNEKRQLKDAQIQLFRVAALLHDIGHYPFSHVMETAVKNFYAAKQVEGADTGAGLSHELVAKEIIEHDPQIRKVLDGVSIDPEAVTTLINRQNPIESREFGNLISSDCDVDKIDYLLRTADHVGLPYGRVDLPYLATQAQRDSEGRFCFSGKAIRVIDHLMLARFFDRMQVAYHKTVVGFELILIKVLEALLDAGLLSLSKQEVATAVTEGVWGRIDDGYVLEKIHQLNEQTRLALLPDETTALIRDQTNAVLHRKPPKLIASNEFFAARTNRDRYELSLQIVRDRMDHWVNESGIPKDYWHLWTKPGFTLTSLASTVPVLFSVTELEPEQIELSAYIQERHGTPAAPIVTLPESMMSVLSDQAFYSIRIYVLLPQDSKVTAAQLGQILSHDLHQGWHLAS